MVLPDWPLLIVNNSKAASADLLEAQLTIAEEGPDTWLGPEALGAWTCHQDMAM